MSSRATSSSAPRAFPHTRWSVIVAAQQDSPETAAALEEICRAYWHPLYAYVRRCGQAPHDAQDLTQAFFARLLEKRWLESVDRSKGRLRTFLIVALKGFMAKEWRRTQTQRHGGGRPHVSLDTTLVESRLAADPASLPPDETFDQQWALTLLDRTIERLRNEFVTAGKHGDFAALKDCLMAARGTIDYDAIARRLGMNEGAARVAVHRLRKQFRQIYREEIELTLGDGCEVETELRHLAAALAQSPDNPM
jgi:RNA polymerase sigma factor (sigma-70 family)